MQGGHIYRNFVVYNATVGLAQARPNEFFGDEANFDKLLSSVGQEELDGMLENSGALVAAAPQPHPSFEKAAPRDLQRYRDKNRNKITEKSTSTWVNRFESWRQWRNVPSKLEEIPREELDNTLQLFYTELRKADILTMNPEVCE